MARDTRPRTVSRLEFSAPAGFTHEGTLRGAAWAEGRFRDETAYGLLAEEWDGRR